MSLSLFIFFCVAVLFLTLLVWLLRDPGEDALTERGLDSPEEFGQRHATYFPQVRRAMAREDFTFLALRGSAALTRRVRRERQKIAVVYLTCLRDDFAKLWRLARVIARMSPRVGIAQEFTRLRLGLTFYLRYELIRVKFVVGIAPAPDLSSLSDMVSKLAIRLETAMSELGERAALSADLASTLHRRGVDAP